jgi:hypothetical protein
MGHLPIFALFSRLQDGSSKYNNKKEELSRASFLAQQIQNENHCLHCEKIST